MYFYNGGDYLDYKKYYSLVESYGIVEGYIFYTSYLGASEPLYYLLSFLGASISLPHFVFSFILNFVLIFAFLRNLKRMNWYTFLIGFSTLLGFHFCMIFTELERLSLGLIFVFLGQSENRKANSYFLYFLGILSHFSVGIIFIARLISDFISLNRDSVKINTNVILPSVFSFLIVFSFFKNRILEKFLYYIGSFTLLPMIEVLLIVTFFLFICERRKYEVLVLGVISLSLSPFLSGGRLLVIILPLFFIFCSENRRIINQLATVPILIYFLTRGLIFGALTVSLGRGITL